MHTVDAPKRISGNLFQIKTAFKMIPEDQNYLLTTQDI